MELGPFQNNTGAGKMTQWLENHSSHRRDPYRSSQISVTPVQGTLKLELSFGYHPAPQKDMVTYD